MSRFDSSNKSSNKSSGLNNTTLKSVAFGVLTACFIAGCVVLGSKGDKEKPTEKADNKPKVEIQMEKPVENPYADFKEKMDNTPTTEATKVSGQLPKVTHDEITKPYGFMRVRGEDDNEIVVHFVCRMGKSYLVAVSNEKATATAHPQGNSDCTNPN